ncbi:TPA: hypothetical protein GXZ54_01805 [bacterium]|nr:hypothetical protein [bacterium]
MKSNQNNVKKEKTILKFDVKDWYYIKSERYKNLSEEEKQNPFLIYMLETCIPNQEKLKLKNTKKA